LTLIRNIFIQPCVDTLNTEGENVNGNVNNNFDSTLGTKADVEAVVRQLNIAKEEILLAA